MPDDIDLQLERFLADLRAAVTAPDAPGPNPELAALFVTGTGAPASRPVAGHPTPRPTRSRNMWQQVLSSLSGKIAAGTVGALVSVAGLGAAGALPAPLQLAAASVGDAVGVPVPSPEEQEGALAGDEALAPQEGGDEALQSTETDAGAGGNETGAGEEGEEATRAVAGDLPPVPTTQREAAHNHSFDEACGNHGAYVSHFARYGEEPECATTARQAAETGAGSDAATEAASADSADSADSAETGKGNGKDGKDGKDGKGSGKAPKAKGGAKAGSKRAK